MTTPKTVAAISAAAIAAAATLSFATAANAAPADPTYVDSIGQGADGSAYPTGWFFGDRPNTTDEQTNATTEWREDGITVAANNELLYNLNATATDFDGLESLISSIDLSHVDGTVSVQIPIFYGEQNAFTTLRPAVAGSAATTDRWVSSKALAIAPSGGGYTLDELETALSTDDITLLAFGFLTLGEAVDVESITGNGSTWLFTPEPEDTPGPGGDGDDDNGDAADNGDDTADAGDDATGAADGGDAADAAEGDDTADAGAGADESAVGADNGDDTADAGTGADADGSDNGEDTAAGENDSDAADTDNGEDTADAGAGENADGADNGEDAADTDNGEQTPVNAAPTTVPSAPVATGSDLPAALEDAITVDQSGRTVHVTGLPANAWSFAYVYSTPTALGWVQADATGAVDVVIPDSIAAGEHRLALLNEAGELIGWSHIEIAADDQVVVDDEQTSDTEPGLAATGQGSAVLPLTAAGLLLAVGALFLVRRRRIS